MSDRHSAPQPGQLRPTDRMYSLDFFRGLIMILLIAESAYLFENLHHVAGSDLLQQLVLQFFHHPWNGLRLWDIIQPAFMFIAGISLALSIQSQRDRGIVWRKISLRVFTRCLWLFFWGVLNYAVERDGTLSFELWNVLTQLSVTTLIALLIFRWGYTQQLIFCGAMLILTEILYRLTNIPGYDQPFVNFHNFGNYADLVLMNKINNDGWVAINVIPTSVHTIAGAMIGKMLARGEWRLRLIVITGVLCVLAGYGLDALGFTPIIKRIATSSFTIVTTGWCLLSFTLLHWWIDVRKHNRYLRFFTIVGMNSLFIYLFIEIVGARWFNQYIGVIASNVLSWFKVSGNLNAILVSIGIIAIEWYLCYFLYKKKVFIKL